MGMRLLGAGAGRTGRGTDGQGNGRGRGAGISGSRRLGPVLRPSAGRARHSAELIFSTRAFRVCEGRMTSAALAGSGR
ncbi:hypothetical protein GCM10009793_36820 [Brachybacterium phenoliresistens]